MTTRSPARVVVLGGGFGGLYAASYLGAADLPEDAAEVTLVSDRNHFTFTPLLAEMVAGTLGQEHVTFPYRVLARRRGFRFVLGRVEGLDAAAGVVETTGGRLRFDYAVVALGGRPRYFANEELRRRAMPLTTVGDAVAIRNRVLAAAERAETVRSAVARRRLLTFAVAGAGPAGVETASEIWHLLREILPAYYDLRAEPRVLLIDGAERILSGWDERLATEGLEMLRRRGIEVRLRTHVLGFDGGTVRTSTDGEETSFDADTLIWTAGTGPASGPLADSDLPLDASGYLGVDPTLAAGGHPNVFAAGDLSRLTNRRTGQPYPPVAPIAISQGVRAAANIENAIAGRAPEEYQAHHAGKIISLGNGTALVDLLGVQLRGRFAWAIYRGTYLLKLVGLKNKVRAGVTLMLNHVFERDLAMSEGASPPT